MDGKMTGKKTVFLVVQTVHLRPPFDDAMKEIPTYSLLTILNITMN
jgi:hypothetical protein